MKKQTENVVLLGASDRKERASHKAFHLLREYGNIPIPINSKPLRFLNCRSYLSLKDFMEHNKTMEVHTLGLYVNEKISSSLTNEIIELNPKRIIFNPGSENKKLFEMALKKGIYCEEACILILLKSGQF